MTTTDLDVLIRDRAYEIWEIAGRPPGEEHRHWAEARRQIEHEQLVMSRILVDDTAAAQEPVDVEPETLRMRQALYQPEPFSVELFGNYRGAPKRFRPAPPANAQVPAGEARRWDRNRSGRV